jgi:Glycosyl transferase family 2
VSTQPTVSIVTPSFNQAKYLDATIRSVLDGSATPDEYIVADGGSTDGSAEIIHGHAARLTRWWSAPDGGQYDAIGRAFAETSGEIMGWLNSDDLYMPWTLSVVKDVFASLPEVEWLTTLYPLTVDADGRVVSCAYTAGFDRVSLRSGANLPFSPGYWRGVQQESTFWRRSLWERAGGRLESSLQLAGDFELWHRFAAHADLVGLEAPLAAFRSHGAQRSATHQAEYLEEGTRVLGGTRRGSRARAAWSVAIGRRSLKRLPRPLANGLIALRLLRRARICAWREGSWVLLDDFVA